MQLHSIRVRFAAALSGLALGIGLAVIPAAPAAAAPLVAPGVPSPVNLPPSVIGAQYSATEGYAALLYGLSKHPEFWEVAAEVQAGKTPAQLTPAQQGVLTTGQKSTVIPWGNKLAPLAKTVGGATAAFSGYTIGAAIGNGTLELLGFDADGAVCRNVGDDPVGMMVGLLAGIDCAAFAAANGWTPNTDVIPGVSMPQLCTASGDSCINTVSMPRFTNQSTGAVTLGLCMTYTGIRPASTTGTSWGVFSQPIAGQPGTYRTIWNLAFSTPSATAAVGSVSRTCHAAGATGFASVTLSADQPQQNVLENPTGYWSRTTSGGVSTYYPNGPVHVAVETPTNPTRTMQCVIAGSNGQTYTGSGVQYTENDPAFDPPTCPNLPEGVLPNGVSIKEQTPGKEGTETIWEAEMQPETQAFFNTYPECAGGTCMLDLRINNQSCFQAPGQCVDWFKDPNRESTYSCHYGTHAVPLSQCNIYAPTFTPQATDTGNFYADPEGRPVPNPSPGNIPGAPPAWSPNENGSCFPSGWSVFNPVEWVLHPIRCAFVPRPSAVSTAQATITQTWQQSPPGTFATFLGTIGSAPSSGCSGIPVDLSWIGDALGTNIGTFHLLAACSGDFFAPIAPLFKFLLSAGFAITGLFGIRRILGNTVNMGER